MTRGALYGIQGVLGFLPSQRRREISNDDSFCFMVSMEAAKLKRIVGVA